MFLVFNKTSIVCLSFYFTKWFCLLQFDSLAVGVLDGLDVLVLDVVSGEEVLQGLEGLLGEWSGSAEDLGV